MEAFILPFIFYRIFLPILTRLIVSRLIGKVAGTTIGNTTESSTVLHGTSNTFAPLQINDTNLDNQTTFAFLYGAIPTAPSVLICASRYGLCENIVIVLFLVIVILLLQDQPCFLLKRNQKKSCVNFFIESEKFVLTWDHLQISRLI